MTPVPSLDTKDLTTGFERISFEGPMTRTLRRLCCLWAREAGSHRLICHWVAEQPR